jgi:hypothetical protein
MISLTCGMKVHILYVVDTTEVESRMESEETSGREPGRKVFEFFSPKRNSDVRYLHLALCNIA